jgi:hypothetical protein
LSEPSGDLTLLEVTLPAELRLHTDVKA